MRNKIDCYSKNGEIIKNNKIYSRLWVFFHYRFWLSIKILDAIFAWKFFSEDKIVKRVGKVFRYCLKGDTR